MYLLKSVAALHKGAQGQHLMTLLKILRPGCRHRRASNICI